MSVYVVVSRAAAGIVMLIVATVVLMMAACVHPAGAGVITVTSKKLAAATSLEPEFFPTSLTLANGGTNAGRAQTGDTVVTVYGAQVQQSTLCSGWTSNTTSTRSLSTVGFTLSDNAGSPATTRSR